MGGKRLDSWLDVKSMLATFWKRHANIDGNTPACPEQTLPIYLHGDEGRGQAKKPLLVISYQSVLGWNGPDRVNSTKFLGVY